MRYSSLPAATYAMPAAARSDGLLSGSIAPRSCSVNSLPDSIAASTRVAAAFHLPAAFSTRQGIPPGTEKERIS